MRRQRLVFSLLVTALLLLLPLSGSAQTNQPEAQAYYTVRRGDTLGDIAWRFGTTAAALRAANHLAHPDRIRPGQILVIPLPAASTSKDKRSQGSRATALPGAPSGRKSPGRVCSGSDQAPAIRVAPATPASPTAPQPRTAAAAAGLSGYQRSAASAGNLQILPGQSLIGMINCAAGKRVLGGGGVIGGNIDVQRGILTLISSGPEVDTGWTVRWVNAGSNTVSVERVEVAAICADVAGPAALRAPSPTAEGTGKFFIDGAEVPSQPSSAPAVPESGTPETAPATPEPVTPAATPTRRATSAPTATETRSPTVEATRAPATTATTFPAVEGASPLATAETTAQAVEPTSAPATTEPTPPAVEPTGVVTPTERMTPTVEATGVVTATVGMTATAGLAGGAPRPASIAQGRELFEQRGCMACHLVDGQGGTRGPDLSHIASQPIDRMPNSAEFLARWLLGPHIEVPEASMPRLVLTEPEVDALVTYLGSLE